MLIEEAKLKGLPEWKKFVVLLFDEMKLSESLVYDKHSAQVIGFVQLGDVNDQLTQFEHSVDVHPPIATHMLGLMVCGVFSNLHFPYAHFATSDNLTGENLFLIMWEAIERLEHLGFKVITLTGDGASQNRKFFKLHCATRRRTLTRMKIDTYTLYLMWHTSLRQHRIIGRILLATGRLENYG